MAGRKRHDPVSKAADGRKAYDRIRGKRPDRSYVLVHPNDIDYYLDEMGYEIETVRPDGPRASGRTLPEGTEVRSGGHILMSCPLAKREAWDADLAVQSIEAEKKMLRDEGMEDGMRGRGIISVRDLYKAGRSFEEAEE